MADRLGRRWQHIRRDEATLDQLIRAFELRNRTLNRSPKTTAWYSNNLRLFRSFLEARGYSLAIGDIDLQVVREYVLHLQTKNKYDSHPFTPARDERLAPCTIRDHVESIKALFAWLAEEGYTEANQLELLRYPKVPRKYVEVLSDAEIRTILSVVDEDSPAGARNTAIVLTFLDSGLRVAELVNLKNGDARIEQGYLKITGRLCCALATDSGVQTGEAPLRFFDPPGVGDRRGLIPWAAGVSRAHRNAPLRHYAITVQRDAAGGLVVFPDSSNSLESPFHRRGLGSRICAGQSPAGSLRVSLSFPFSFPP